MPPPKKKKPMEDFIAAARGAEDDPSPESSPPKAPGKKAAHVRPQSPKKAHTSKKQVKAARPSSPSTGEELRLNRGEVSHWSVAGDKHKGTYYLPLELRARLVAFASTQGLNASEVVERAVEKFIGPIEEEE